MSSSTETEAMKIDIMNPNPGQQLEKQENICSTNLNLTSISNLKKCAEIYFDTINIKFQFNCFYCEFNNFSLKIILEHILKHLQHNISESAEIVIENLWDFKNDKILSARCQNNYNDDGLGYGFSNQKSHPETHEDENETNLNNNLKEPNNIWSFHDEDNNASSNSNSSDDHAMNNINRKLKRLGNQTLKLKKKKKIQCNLDYDEFDDLDDLPLNFRIGNEKSMLNETFKTNTNKGTGKSARNRKTLKEKRKTITVVVNKIDKEQTGSKPINKKLKNHYFKCKFCSMKFQFISQLTRHEARHYGPKKQGRKHVGPELEKEEKKVSDRPICHICSKISKDMWTLKKHLITHDENRQKFACGLCSKVFFNAISLKSHTEMIHQKIKPFQCKKCHKAYHSDRALREHMKYHNEERKFECTICKKKYLYASKLSAHINIYHIQGRAFACNLCEKRYFDQSTLNVHLITHSKERQFACDKCPNTYTRKSGLETHLKTHSTIKQYRCKICQHEAPHYCAIYAHYKSHGIKYSVAYENNSTPPELITTAGLKISKQIDNKMMNK